MLDGQLGANVRLFVLSGVRLKNLLGTWVQNDAPSGEIDP